LKVRYSVIAYISARLFRLKTAEKFSGLYQHDKENSSKFKPLTSKAAPQVGEGGSCKNLKKLGLNLPPEDVLYLQ